VLAARAERLSDVEELATVIIQRTQYLRTSESNTAVKKKALSDLLKHLKDRGLSVHAKPLKDLAITDGISTTVIASSDPAVAAKSSSVYGEMRVIFQRAPLTAHLSSHADVINTESSTPSSLVTGEGGVSAVAAEMVSDLCGKLESYAPRIFSGITKLRARSGAYHKDLSRYGDTSALLNYEHTVVLTRSRCGILALIVVVNVKYASRC